MTRETVQTGIGWVVLIALGVTAWRQYWRQPDPLDHMGARVQFGVFYGERPPITPIPLYSGEAGKRPRMGLRPGASPKSSTPP